jgi:Raf kinase inhibitor-like YbhB/YbcL family protein
VNRTLAAAALLLLAACDTGDGKELQPVDPADIPTSTVAPPTTVAVPFTGDGATTGAVESMVIEPDEREPFQLAAPWRDGDRIDQRYTCDGRDVAPPLSWGAVPEGTVEIALSMIDESAVSNGQPFVHWVIAGLDPDEIAIAEGDVPPPAVQAINFFGDIGYGGPCPPPGDDPHRYRLTAYALNQTAGVADGTPAIEFLEAVEAVTIESVDLTGTFRR